MKTRLQTSLGQQLVLTPQLQQAIKLLQMSTTELELEIAQAVESNPLLDWADSNDGPAANEASDGNDSEAPSERADDGDDWAPAELDWSAAGSGGSFDDDDDTGSAAERVAETETLADHLLWQLHLSHLSARDRSIGATLIDALDEDGYLRDGVDAVHAALPAELGATAQEIEAVRQRVQRFDPTGIASLDLRDCLFCQLSQFADDTPHRDLAMRIVNDELELLARNDIPKIARKFKAPEDEVAAAAALIRTLDPRPGAALDATPVEYVAPDVYARRENGRWQVSLNPDAQPRLGLNQHYCGLIARARGDDATWMKGQLQEARWLLKSLQSRAETLTKVAEAIVRRQSAFLDYGPEAMHPLVLREVAEEVGMHESTISRVTTRKYMHTPRGTFELKHFFSSGVATEDGGSASATAIQAMLRKLIGGEDPRKPLSDQALAEELHGRGIQVARRTVAKYREALRIPSSSERVRAG